MLRSLLLHLDCAPSAVEGVRVGVSLAAQLKARLRGLLLLDTRRLSTLAISSESASSCAGELERLALLDSGQESVRSELSFACTAADVPLEIRQLRGDPLALLPGQAAFHDLVVTTLATPEELGQDTGRLSVADVLQLVQAGVHPLLILRPRREVRRVLLINDGTQSSAVAIRQYVSHRLFPGCEHRLLAVGDTAEAARARLDLLSDYARQQRIEFESGCLQGSLRQLLLPYVQKWEADLVILGVARRSSLLRPLWQSPLEQLLQKCNVGLYTSG